MTTYSVMTAFGEGDEYRQNRIKEVTEVTEVTEVVLTENNTVTSAWLK
ncbi:hypothetical protein ACG0Z5_10555 [Scandinavium sp. M-37]